ncbi:MAG: DUF3820 family protein [Bacteroidales bacterium]|nr:DUF3820 family protein [Bacteroidales bacterium]
MNESPLFDPTILTDLVSMRMPFGKYKDYPLYRLPEPYLVWFKQKGFPKGKLGILLETLYEIKLNGLEYLLENIRKKMN